MAKKKNPKNKQTEKKKKQVPVVPCGTRQLGTIIVEQIYGRVWERKRKKEGEREEGRGGGRKGKRARRREK